MRKQQGEIILVIRDRNGRVTSCGGVEGFLELSNRAEDFVEVGNVAEEHGAEHGLVVRAPVGELIRGRAKTEGAGLVGRVVHPGVTEEDFPVFGDTLEEGGIRQRPLAYSGTEQASEVVVMPGHA